MRTWMTTVMKIAVTAIAAAKRAPLMALMLGATGMALRPRERHHSRRVPGSDAGIAADAGMATTEYAIATIAAAGFAGLLVVILKSEEVRALLMGLVRSALSA